MRVAVYYKAIFGNHEIEIGFAKDYPNGVKTITPGIFQAQNYPPNHYYLNTAEINFGGESSDLIFDNQKENLYLKRQGKGFVVAFSEIPLIEKFTQKESTASVQFYFEEE